MTAFTWLTNCTLRLILALNLPYQSDYSPTSSHNFDTVRKYMLGEGSQRSWIASSESAICKLFPSVSLLGKIPRSLGIILSWQVVCDVFLNVPWSVVFEDYSLWIRYVFLLAYPSVNMYHYITFPLSVVRSSSPLYTHPEQLPSLQLTWATKPNTAILLEKDEFHLYSFK